MYIQELTSKPHNKFVTVTLSYDDIRDIANGLFCASQHDEKYKGVYAECKCLFDMVKHGMVQSTTIEKLHEINNNANE